MTISESETSVTVHRGTSISVSRFGFDCGQEQKREKRTRSAKAGLDLDVLHRLLGVAQRQAPSPITRTSERSGSQKTSTRRERESTSGKGDDRRTLPNASIPRTVNRLPIFQFDPSLPTAVLVGERTEQRDRCAAGGASRPLITESEPRRYSSERSLGWWKKH